MTKIHSDIVRSFSHTAGTPLHRTPHTPHMTVSAHVDSARRATDRRHPAAPSAVQSNLNAGYATIENATNPQKQSVRTLKWSCTLERTPPCMNGGDSEVHIVYKPSDQHHYNASGVKSRHLRYWLIG
jgi:hypothetical protein